MADLTELTHPLIILMGLSVRRSWGWHLRIQPTLWKGARMETTKATLRVDRSGGGYLVRVRVKGPTGTLANGHIGGVAENDLKEAIEALMAALVEEVTKAQT